MGGGFKEFAVYGTYKIFILADNYYFYCYVNGHLITSRSLSTATSWGNDDTNTPVYVSDSIYSAAPISLKNIIYTDRMVTTCAPTPVPTEVQNWKLVFRQVGID